mgnify:CR=1 FL=1
MKNNLIVILGSTASGKTSLAVKLACEIDGEIISADSRQVYRGMDLGTGKDLTEYHVEGRFIPYHMIDIIDPEEEFNLFQFQRRFVRCFQEIHERERIAMLVGGTGLYLESVLLNYRLKEVPENQEMRAQWSHLGMEELVQLYLSMTGVMPHNKSDLTDRNRLVRAIEIAAHGRSNRDTAEQDVLRTIVPIILGVRWERAKLRARITERLKSRLAAGLIDEVKTLKDQGISWERLDAFGLEYRYVSRYLRGRLTYEEMFGNLETKIHQFAKRQDTWFRRMEKRGISIRWINGNDYGEVRNYIQGMLLI